LNSTSVVVKGVLDDGDHDFKARAQRAQIEGCGAQRPSKAYRYDMTEVDGFEEDRLRQHHSIRGDMKSCRSPQQGASLFFHNLLVCQLPGFGVVRLALQKPRPEDSSCDVMPRTLWSDVHSWLLEQPPPKRTHSPTQHLSIYLLLYRNEGKYQDTNKRTREVQRETTATVPTVTPDNHP
jgi:hypothetical protein